jgi:hypothetical protein
MTEAAIARRRMPLTDLPFWPRCLSRDEAARYVGVSVPVFDDEVRAGIWPPGMRRGRDGNRLTWDRNVLDSCLDSRLGLMAGQAPGAPAVTDAPLAQQDETSVEWENRLNAPTSDKRRPRRH